MNIIRTALTLCLFVGMSNGCAAQGQVIERAKIVKNAVQGPLPKFWQTLTSYFKSAPKEPVAVPENLMSKKLFERDARSKSEKAASPFTDGVKEGSGKVIGAGGVVLGGLKAVHYFCGDYELNIQRREAAQKSLSCSDARAAASAAKKASE